MLNTKHSKGFFIRLISGITLGVIAIVATLSIMLPSHATWKKYYDNVMAEKKQKEYLNSLPFKFLGISAELNKGVKYYDNGTAEPETSDFSVKANFTEKGKDFSEKLSMKEFTMTVPEDFAKNGGTIVFSYSYQPEDTKNDKGETVTPEPIEAKTELNVSLVAPDETVFAMRKEPTFTEDGYAENIAGTKKTLPSLNLTDYTTKTYSESYIKFTHNETGIVLKKYITDKINVAIAGKTIEYNNVDCHFATDGKDVKISYENQTFVFNAVSKNPVLLGKIDANAIKFASGEFNIDGVVTVNGLTVVSGVKLGVSGRVFTSDMTVERNATLNITATDGTPLLLGKEENGLVRLYGNVNVVYTGTKEVTALGCDWRSKDGTEIYIADSSCVSISGEVVQYSIGCWLKDNTKKVVIYYPETAMFDKDSKAITSASGEKLLSYVGTYNRTQFTKRKEGCTLVTPATPTSTGLAKSESDGKDYVLPKLNFNDYKVEVSGNKFTFSHIDTGVSIDYTLNEKVTIGDLTLSYSTENVCDFSVADGKTVNLYGLNSVGVVVSGKGSLVLSDDLTIPDNSLLNVKSGKLTVKGNLVVSENASIEVASGATLDVTTEKDDIMRFIGGGKSVAKLYGTVNLSYTGTGDKTGISCDYRSKSGISVYLSDTSRVNIQAGNNAIGSWSKAEGANNNIYVYYPSTATYSAGEKKITSESGNVLLTYKGNADYNVGFRKAS